MRSILTPCLLFAVLVFAGAASAADSKAASWKGVQKMMTPQEFHAAGLDKLSPEELSRLNEWFLHFVAFDAEQVARTDKKVQKLQKTPVRHHIPGHFSGWTGHTTFVLDNGEVWKQRLDDQYYISLDNPEVEIFKNLLGFYELRVIKTGRKVGVTRVR